MNRSLRIGLFVMVLLGVVGGSVLAANLPRAQRGTGLADASESPEESASADELAHAVDRLLAHDITTDVDELGTLAGKYGLGGAVRLMAWSKTTGKSVAELSALRDEGTGWGRIAHELGVSPGIGWIMGNGHGGAGKADKQKDHKPDADESESPDAAPGG